MADIKVCVCVCACVREREDSPSLSRAREREAYPCRVLHQASKCVCERGGGDCVLEGRVVLRQDVVCDERV